MPAIGHIFIAAYEYCADFLAGRAEGSGAGRSKAAKTAGSEA